MRQRFLRVWISGGVAAAVFTPNPALADNCGDLTDCFKTLSTALWVIAAVALVAAAVIAFPYLVAALGPGMMVGAGAGGGTLLVGGSVALPAAVWTSVQIAGAAAGTAILTDTIMMMSKQSRGSGKERGTDIPSWAKGQRPQGGETPRQAAERILNEQYGSGNWGRGPGSEFNKIKKFFERLLRRGQ